MMQNATVYCQATKAQPVPRQWQHPWPSPFSFIVEHGIMVWDRYPFGRFGSTVLVPSHPRFLCALGILAGRAA